MNNPLQANFRKKLDNLNFDLKKIKKYTELEIIFQEIHNIKTAYIYRPSYLTFIQIVTKAGSQIEERKEWGISHILEHLLFKGSKKRPSGIEIMNAYSTIGASMNAYTDYDHTNYYISMLNDVFEDGFDIISDMYLNPLLRESDLKKEINPILSEYREKEDDPEDFLIEESLQRFLYPYHSILGTKENIQNVNIKQTKNFKENYYINPNIIITAVGGIEPEIFFSKVKEYFSENSYKNLQLEYPKCNYNKGELVLQKKDIQESYYVLLFPAYSNDSPDRFKQNLLNFILGGMDSSLLFEKIREELGLSCYEIYSNINRNQSFSYLEIVAGISREEIKILEKEIFAILEKIKNEYISSERIQKAKNILKTMIVSHLESTKGLSSLLLSTLLRNEYKNPIEEILYELENITKEDLLLTAQKTFTENYFKGILIPK